MDCKQYVNELGIKAKAAEASALALTEGQKNLFLKKAAADLREYAPLILLENAKDINAAVQNGIKPSMIDRLKLDEKRVEGIAAALEELTALKDPVGEIIDGWNRPNGLQILRKRVPIGVIGIIYEARPNVTVDAAALCVKAGNAVILRGGKEALHTNIVLTSLLRNALNACALNPDIIQLVDDPSREAANEMMRAIDHIDVLIPRGGAGLIRSVKENAKVPVIETGAGNCHAYIDKDADIGKALDIVYNAKTSRPSVCNAIETVLVHNDIAEEFLPLLKERLDEKNVVWYGCERTKAIIDAIEEATEVEYMTEFNDYTLAVKVVDSVEEAIGHINHYSTKHSEVIVTENITAAKKFEKAIRSAVVYVNASTRFTDGGEFGFGAEIGISTGKLHARGPMGLNELTTVQYVVTGDGQIRE